MREFMMDRLKARRLVRQRLENGSYPRLQMSLLVLLTGAAGFLASYLMHRMGMQAMGARYFLSMCAAYGAFLLMLGFWISRHVDDMGDSGIADAPDVLDSLQLLTSGPDAAPSAGGGGTFDAIGDTMGSIGDADELAVPLIIFFIVLLLAAMVLSALFVVYSAPALLTEILVDAMLSASLYRRLQGLDQKHWLETAIRRTVLPFVLTTIIVTVCGIAIGRIVPGAHSLGEALTMARGTAAK
jgi:FtsH-binding integral membrane protein